MMDWNNDWSDKLWVDAFSYRQSIDDGDALEAEDKNLSKFKAVLRQLDNQTWLNGTGDSDIQLDPDIEELWNYQNEQHRKRRKL
jgi:hypothetical protein